MVNKTSPGGRGGKKKLKKVSIFFQKGVFKGGGTMLPRGGPKKPSYAPVCIWSNSLPEHSLKRYKYLFKKEIFWGAHNSFLCSFSHSPGSPPWLKSCVRPWLYVYYLWNVENVNVSTYLIFIITRLHCSHIAASSLTGEGGEWVYNWAQF